MSQLTCPPTQETMDMKRLGHAAAPATGGTIVAPELTRSPGSTARSLAGAPAPTSPPPRSELGGEALAQALAEVLAEAVGVSDVAPDADFFADLGADSLVMAKFCAKLRKRPGAPTVSMRDVYAHPSLAALTRFLTDRSGSAPEVSPIATAVPAAVPARPEGTPEKSGPPVGVAPAGRPGRVAYLGCGVAQVLVYLAYTLLMATVTLRGYLWLSEPTAITQIYLRSVAVGAGTFGAMCALPIALKWLLIGRWTSTRFPLWGPAYLRFWLVRASIRACPLGWYTGSPLVSVYLRALGAKVGPGAVILTRHIPVCTDLVTIGAGAVVRKDVFMHAYRVQDGLLETGRVDLGPGSFVGQASVLDIGTDLGAGAELGHRSTLHAGQSVPAGASWHGSPARPTDVRFALADPLPDSRARRFLYGLAQLLLLLLVVAPAGIGLLTIVLRLPGVSHLYVPGPHSFTQWPLYADALGLATVLLVLRVAGAFFLATVPTRLLRPLLVAGRTYRMHGLRYAAHRWIARLSNSPSLLKLIGESSYVVGYLRAIGYDLGRVQQTGSNFGEDVRHESPFHVRVGTGTMVADGLSIANAEYGASSFRVTEARVGAHSFLGNHIVLSGDSRVGDNCLLATKVMVPVDGPVRHDIGLLGSPCFEIPRSVERDTSVHMGRGELHRRLRAKDRHNLATIAIVLLVQWVGMVLTTTISLVGLDLVDRVGALAVAGLVVANLLVLIGWAALVERASTGFRSLTPRLCSIYDSYFWFHERMWKLHAPTALLTLFNGTPVRPALWRLFGVRMGARVFDDGCHVSERTLVTVGAGANLNAGTIIQSHSQEDGMFKSDRDDIGANVTLGVGALVHYGVVVGDSATVATDSFLMKGEVVPPHSLWGGNPAREIRNGADAAGSTLSPAEARPLPSRAFADTPPARVADTTAARMTEPTLATMTTTTSSGRDAR